MTVAELKSQIVAINERNRKWLREQGRDRGHWTPEQREQLRQNRAELSRVINQLDQALRDCARVVAVDEPEVDDFSGKYTVTWYEVVDRTRVVRFKPFRVLAEAELFYSWMASRRGRLSREVRVEMEACARS